jgi:hypothetical protein
LSSRTLIERLLYFTISIEAILGFLFYHYLIKISFEKLNKFARNQRIFCHNAKKIHFVICGKTASEIIYSRADSQKENMKYFHEKNSCI